MMQTGHRNNSFGMPGQLINVVAAIALHAPTSPRSTPGLVARAATESAEVPSPLAAPFLQMLVPSPAVRLWVRTESLLWAPWGMMNAAAVMSSTVTLVALGGNRRRTPPVMDGFPR